METTPEYRSLAKKLSNQAKGTVMDWFARRDGFCPYTIDDFYVTWIAKVDKHFKAYVAFKNDSQPSGNMVWVVDIYQEGERVVTAYEVLGVTVYNVNETWKKPQLIGFDDSLI